MNTTQSVPPTVAQERVSAHNTVTRRLGRWTTCRHIEVRSHHGRAVVDLRSPQIEAGDIEVELDLDHATLVLLLPDDAVVDDWHLTRVGRSKVKDAVGSHVNEDRKVVLSGQLRRSEVRVRRDGTAVLSAMFTREYLDDVRRAHKQGGHPTVDDPARTA